MTFGIIRQIERNVIDEDADVLIVESYLTERARSIDPVHHQKLLKNCIRCLLNSVVEEDVESMKQHAESHIIKWTDKGFL